MKEFLSFIFSKRFLLQLLYVLIFLILVLFGVLMWLRSYTNHGQKIELPDYENVDVTKATKDAKKKTFKIIVTDSTHIVGKPGGLILDQNPKPGAMVKEKRKIYVTTTKYKADEILVKDLPLLYGTEYDQAKFDLKPIFINAEIRSKRYDAGQPNHILEVWYNDELIIDKDHIKSSKSIEKGGTLSFVVSEREGGSFPIPNLTCMKLSDAKSYMMHSKLNIGKIVENGDISDPEEAYIIAQFPKYDNTSELEQGASIDVSIAQQKPANCN